MYGKRLAAITTLLLAGSVGAAETQEESVEPLSTAYAAHPADPWQGFNRAIFGFNDGFDHYFFKPVAKGYRYVMPDPVETGVSNAYGNLLELRNILNDVLQWKWKQAGNDTGRLLVNSTIGLVGVFDVAGKMGLDKSEGEDFGQTLAVWGVNSGPYLVLPLMGPSTLRDGAALPVDFSVSPIGYIDHVPTRNVTVGLGQISNRANLLQAEALLSGDRYAFLRDAFLQRREYLINDGLVEDDFGADVGSDWGTDEYDY